MSFLTAGRLIPEYFPCTVSKGSLHAIVGVPLSTIKLVFPITEGGKG